ncbi:Lipopolysaccharide assembly protein B [Fundidesulfovibrio magnetotacticus]|uniref:Lipopolysaccharide assembly protein B n=1 Tax=Fundidesulfovibrio magnetotacticus TaxID=2730080 RepID=A0A6V8LQD6_9BACT|nr:tetratricopeptide repeat protein [Fundidesulfovibrio magnetotacticus]GFK92771.1 Lipopolysaccharide assembly protein B [Fundidesulfovibrio magnetotacticus]
MSESMDIQEGGQSPRVASRPRDKIKGIFSTQSIQKVGTGTTTRKTIQKTYWFVEELEENQLEIQPLNKNYIPSGPKRKITIEDLLAKFAPEPEFYISTVYPKLQELSRTIQKGERHREKGEIFSAELEFGQALKVDEENVRANFGLGLTYLDRGEAHKANDIFERLVRLDAAFEPEHKHLFNDFGISLRKNKMLDQALDYYRKAESLTESDENLFYNIARAYFEKDNATQCLEYLKNALRLNPELVEARKFVKYLVEQNKVSLDLPGVRELLPRDDPSRQPINVGI